MELNLTESEMEQSMYTLEMCVATLLQKSITENTLDQSHTHVYSELLSSTAKMRDILTGRGVVLEMPLYMISTENPIQLSA